MKNYIFTILLIVIQSQTYCFASDLSIKSSYYTKVPESISFDDVNLTYDGKDLSIAYKNHTHNLMSGTEHKGGSGNGYDIASSEVKRNHADSGILIAVVGMSWYMAASNYGETYTLHIFALKYDQAGATEQSTLQKIGEWDLGNSGKGLEDTKSYSLRWSGTNLYSLMISKKANKAQYDIDLAKGSFNQVNIKQLSISPSFHCADNLFNLSFVENIICRNNHAANLDLIMSKLYASSAYANKRKDQLEWLTERNQCGSDVCLIEAYNSRIFSLVNSR